MPYPPTIASYDDLCAATADWLNRQDLINQIPAFITLTTAQFNRELRLRDMLVPADTTSNLELVALPSDWLETYSLVIQPGAPPNPQNFQPAALRYMSEKESNDIKAQMYGSPGQPYGYTLIGSVIELVPAPSDNVNLRMVYYARIPDLVTGSGNCLLSKSPDLYLYGTCLQAAPYLKDDDRLQTWGNLRTGLIEMMRLESERAMRPTSGVTARAKAF